MIYQVKNWKGFQHYKDRSPPWIKLHFEVLTSRDWVMVDDASKLLAIVCMLIASRNDGMVEDDLAYIQAVGHLKKLPDLKPLIKSGFLVLVSDESGCKQAQANASECYNREETEERRGETEKPSRFDEFWTAFPKTRIGDKDNAKAAYKRALKKDTEENILAGLQRYLPSDEVANGYAKGCAAWLNDSRWMNSYEGVQKPKIGKPPAPQPLNVRNVCLPKRS